MQTQLITMLAVLSILGVIDSIYLYYKHSKKQPLVCLLNTNCNAVLNSKWSHIFGIRNELFGIAYYSLIFIGSFVLFYNETHFIHISLRLISFLAMIFSAFLIYLQKYVIKEYCFYCIISAIISLLILVIILLL